MRKPGKRITALAAVMVLLSLTACQGEVPFVSDSDPTYTVPLTSGRESEKSTAESSGSVSSVSRTTESSGSRTTTGTTEAQPEGELELSLAQWHPGIPGYDAVYPMTVKYGGEYANAEDVHIQSETDGVRIVDGAAVVSETVREGGVPVRITARYAPTGQIASLEIPVRAWEMTFNDEFDGTDLDMRRWSLEETCYENDIAATVRENHRVQNGCLELIGEKRTVTLYGLTKEYTTAACTTKGLFRQRYGCFLTRMKAPQLGGLNAAFWLIPGGSYGRYYGSFLEGNTRFGLAEIDIIEISDNWDDHYYTTEHFYDYTAGYEHMQRSFYVDVEGDTVNEWHTYGCVWDRDALYYYCDGRLVGTRSDLADTGDGGVKGRDMYLLLSLGMGEPEGGWLGGWTFDETEFPAVMSVDWVRVYK